MQSLTTPLHIRQPVQSLPAKRKKRTPHQFLNGILEEACDVIRNVTGFHNMPNRSMKKCMHPPVKEDDRLFTGLCIVQHSWRLQWNSLGEYLADFEPVEDCPCGMCNGQYEHPTLRKMLQASIWLGSYQQ